MNWLRENKRFTTGLAVLLALCLLVVFSYTSAGSSTAVGRGVQKGVSVISKPIVRVADGIGDFFTGVLSYKEIQKENEELSERVEELEKENRELRMTAAEKEELESLYKAFDFKPYSPSSKAVAGQVIETDLSNPYIVFTVDVGTESGVEKDCIVVDGSGLIGRVTETGDGWSKIVSVLSDGNDISFCVLRDKTVTGVVYGNGKDGMSGYVMDDTYRIIKGDELITTGIGIYPAGIPIGVVSAVEYDDDRQQRVITVEPTADFRGMQKVAIFL